MVGTYSDDGWLLWHSRRGLLLDLLFDAEVLHIASSEDDLPVDGLCGRDLVTASAALGTEGAHIL